MSTFSQLVPPPQKTEPETLVDLVQTYPNYVRAVSDYSFEKEIGQGGFGTVTLMHDISTDLPVAMKEVRLKELDERNLTKYIREIHTMALANNRFVLPLRGFTAEPPYCIMTEYLSNGSLSDYIYKKNALSPTHMTAIAMCVANGMAHLHSLGIVHRDLKPGNILMDRQMFPRIIDFGLARRLSKTKMTGNCGTVWYMAPEMFISPVYDEKIDVYAYGMMMFELCEKTQPYKDLSSPEISRMVCDLNVRPQFTKNTPQKFQDLISRCWNRDPRQRPSFQQIYNDFANHTLEFPHTDREKINGFVSSISEFEQRRLSKPRDLPPIKVDINAIISRLQPKRSKPIPKPPGLLQSPPPPPSGTVNITPPPPSSSIKITPPPTFNHMSPPPPPPGSINMSPAPVFSHVTPPPPPPSLSKPKPQSQKPVTHQIKLNPVFPKPARPKRPPQIQKVSLDTLRTTLSIDLLKDPKSRQFSQYLDLLKDTLQQSEFDNFLDIILSNFTPDIGQDAMVGILQTILCIMNRQHSFIEYAYRKGLFFLNTYISPQVIRLFIDMIAILFINRTKIVDENILAPLGFFITYSPLETLKLFYLYGQHFQYESGRVFMFDFLLSHAGTYSKTPYASEYMGLWIALFFSLNPFYLEYVRDIQPILGNMVLTQNLKQAVSAYRAIIHTYSNDYVINTDVLQWHLQQNDTSYLAVSLIKRMPVFVLADHSLDRMIKLATQDQGTNLAITRSMSLLENARTMMKIGSWLKLPLPTMQCTARITLAIMRHAELRSELLNHNLFVEHLMLLVNTRNSIVHALIPLIIKKLGPDEAILMKLQMTGFIKAYLTFSCDSQDPDVTTSTLMLLDTLANIGKARDYRLYIKNMSQLITNHTRHAHSALATLVVLSKYQDCIEEMKETGLLRYFQGLSKYDTEMQLYSQIILKNASAYL